MTASWIPNIAYIADSIDKVAAKDTNRPLQQFDQRTQYLFDLFQTISAGELIAATNVTLDPATVPGTPVYFDDATNTFRPGISAVNIAPGNNYGFPDDRSVIRGVVLTKYGPTAGDVALVGRIKNSIWGINWATVIDTGALVSGVYYLDSKAAGKLTKSRSNLSVYLGSLNSVGDLILNPVINGNIRDHLHYRFELKAALVSDLSTEGWAPVAFFPNAPAGATYGYNIGLNAPLKVAFPPIPVDACYFEYQGRGVHEDAFIIDANGIWWKGTPLPNALTSDPDFAPPTYHKYFVLWVTRLNFGAPFVSTLDGNDSASTIPVAFVDINGNPASSGDLRAAITQSIKVNPALAEGGLALKVLNGVQGQFGPVVGRVFAGPGISLDGASGDDINGWYGDVTVTAGASSVITGTPELVAMDNATEDFYGNLPVLEFPELRVSSMRARVNVPTGIPAGRSIQLTLDVIGVGAGTVTLNLTYVIVRAGQPIVQTEVPLAPLVIALVANQFTRVSSDLIPVNPGDTVYYRITQPNAGLASAVPILRMQYGIMRTP